MMGTVEAKVHDPNDGPATEPEQIEEQEDTGVEHEEVDDDNLGLDDDDDDEFDEPEYEEGLLGDDDD